MHVCQMTDVKKGVEAILFAAGRVVKVKELQDLLNLKDKGLIVEAVKELTAEYEGRESPLMIIEEDEGWKLTVREAHLGTVHSINPHTELSKTILETLAVIAWKQPMLQSDVVKIRTNKSYDHISELEKLGFITRERFGRSYLIKVTQKFLDYFDLPEPKAMKEMFKDFKDISAVKKRGAKEARPEEQQPPVGGEDVDLDTYVDALPPMETPKTGPHLETYEYPADIKTPEIEESEEEKELEDEKLAEAEAAFEKEAEAEEQESPDEKAKRLAKELLEDEEEQAEEEAEEEERKLHPKLEEFIAAEHQPEPPRVAQAPEEKAGESSEEGDSETSEEEKSEDKATDDSGQEGSDEDGGSEKPKPAEEYPGQFDGQEEEADKKDA